jgi:hypothetical protein
MKLLRGSTLGLLATASICPGLASAQIRAAPRPSLVVLVAVDQMRGDYLARYADQWTGGFARFWNQGTVFANGRQDHASTETAPGHATMLSGREPTHTGILLNSRGIQDPDAPVLGAVDPIGASPRRFEGTTLYDWMLRADSGARVLSVSRKDRAAILTVGRGRGDIYWFAGGLFTTSRYYADSLPAWVRTFNEEHGVQRLAGTTWDLLRPAAQYAEPDSEPFENGGSDFVFPHQLPDTSLIAARIAGYPWMDSLTIALALRGVNALGLGRRDGPDLLVLALSSTDAVGHVFGPDSRELHDQLLRVDLWLGQFLDSLARLVPAERTVLALTGDHGITALPEYTVMVRHRPGGRVWLGGLAAALEATLERRYHAEFGLSFENGLLSADVAALRARGIDGDSLSRALAQEAQRLPGVARVYTPASLAAAPVADRDARLWKRLIPAGYGWLLCATTAPGYIWSRGSLIAEHGGGDADDVSVPIAFLGPAIRARHIAAVARSVDIGPTLAALIGVQPTEPVDGVVLREVVSSANR